MTEDSVGTDHCRVVPPESGATALQQVPFLRHLFAYVEATRWLPPAARLLEIGAGEGYGAHTLASHAARVIATDLSWQALRHAAARYHDVCYCNTPGTRLPFASETFDAAVSFQVIEHIPDADTYLHEVKRILKPGGRFILTTPNRRWRLLPLQRPWNPYHMREYSDRQLRRTLRRVFATVQMFGVVATSDIMELEKAQVRQSPAFVYPAMLMRVTRKIVLRLWERPPGKLMVALTPRPWPRALPAIGHESVDVQDFSLSRDPDSGLDFFVVATK
jgi:ubiquinone/menaquinone biosynthesis C-methylase UbiE